MRDHVKILGILNIVLGCLGALLGVAVLLIFGGIAGIVGFSGDASDARTAVPVLTIIGVALAGLVFVLSVPAIVGGWGLLSFRPWARVLMIIVSALNLLHVPIGTALGIYGLWTLLSEETRRLFETGGQLPTSYAAPIGSYPPPPPPAPGL